MRVAREEIFGPVVSVLPCASLDEAIDIANDVAYGLSASIYTQDINKAFAAMRDVYTGIFYVNAPTIGRGSAPAVWRDQGDRQRPQGGRDRGARRVLRMEVGVRRLQRQAATGAD
jgi:acyl-CoA reductase-like NAD-dependent aldehyde dehydrogenase